MRRKIHIGNDSALQIESSIGATPASQKSMDTSTVFRNYDPIEGLVMPTFLEP
ncbi:hypothetical protein BT96DRAFT_919257 [Gymnopus androsaceus JB14]|uniref:Uncharacterized protein n=1 Tax=Gymnopus androsaceus JB14 TaxID=1447944 RepID=A0A6A4HQT5_9AGAR|nr:hypothetical protein BT96DRAFT_919257 [Gymnopus androsaceus JB14]